MQLTDLKVRTAKPKALSYKLSDGGGMYLLVTPTGARYWRLDYRFMRKRRTLALGVYPSVTLSNARERREQAKALLARDIDPSTIKRANRHAARLAGENTFEAVARDWLSRQRKKLAPRYSALLLPALRRIFFRRLALVPSPILAHLSCWRH
jgi:hypothetical protein